MPFDLSSPIQPGTIGALAQIIPALLAIGLFLPVLNRVQLTTTLLVHYITQNAIVLAVEGLLLVFLIDDKPVIGGWKVLIGVGCLFALIGVISSAFGWQRVRRQTQPDVPMAEGPSLGRKKGKGRKG